MNKIKPIKHLNDNPRLQGLETRPRITCVGHIDTVSIDGEKADMQEKKGYAIKSKLQVSALLRPLARTV